MESSHSLRCLLLPLMAGLALSACQPFGPGRQAMMRAGSVPAGPDQQRNQIKVVQVRGDMAASFKPPAPWPAFAEVLGGTKPVGTVVGVGDALEVTIWEAPPATLFGGPAADTRIGTAINTARPSTLPELLVSPDGNINVPFAGAVPAGGRTLRDIESEIVRRLRGRANAPQVLVRLVRNATATVTVVGEVGQSARVPLTPRGERLLDALAQVGGVKPPVNLTTIQVTRNGRIHRSALADIIERSENNVVLAKDDVVTALFQPYSFTVLGAAGRNDEIRFEALGISLSQALGRIGGLQDGRANPRGVFLFRWEDPATPGAPRMPVIYSFDLKDPAVYFLAQQFRMSDKDLIYITNSPVAELQRFVGIVSQTLLPIATVTTVIQQD
jgi:polysaccharide export outer membrane protein